MQEFLLSEEITRGLLPRLECSCRHTPTCASNLFRAHHCLTVKDKVDIVLSEIRGEAMRRGAPARAAGQPLLSARESIEACTQGGWMAFLEDLIAAAAVVAPSGGKGVRPGRSPAIYLLAGVMVCRGAVTALLGTNARTVGRKMALQREEGTAGFKLPTHPGGGAGNLAAKRGRAKAWYQEAHVNFGNRQPDSDVVIVDKTTWKDLHTDYKSHLESQGEADLVPSRSYLRRVLIDEFPHVRRRKDKGISGHCITCEALDRAIAWAKGKRHHGEATMYYQLKLHHNRDMQQLERAQYYTMRELATKYPEKVRLIQRRFADFFAESFSYSFYFFLGLTGGFSITQQAVVANKLTRGVLPFFHPPPPPPDTQALVIILDGMDQFKTRCPRYAGKVKYEGTTLQQKLVGVLVHGRGFYTYRAFANTQHGTNLMIDCLMRTLVRLPKPLPRNLFLQVDGGPENRSKALYGFLAYLVGAGFFDEVSYSLADYLTCVPTRGGTRQCACRLDTALLQRQDESWRPPS